MLDLNPIKITDMQVFNRYLQINKYRNSEYTFTTWFAWQKLYRYKFTVINDCLCVFGEYDGLSFAYFPIGEKENTKAALEYLLHYFNGKGKKLTLMSVSEMMTQLLEEFGMNDMFVYENRRDFADYICLKENFIQLSGKKLHTKRNHYNYFVNNFSYELLPLTPELLPECKSMLKEVINDRNDEPDDELRATNVILNNRNELGLRSNIMYVDGNPAGVILGENQNGTVIIHIAKADVAYRGASVALFKLFLENNFTQCEYVNLMEDMGIEGLRRAKLGYSPERLLEKSILTQI